MKETLSATNLEINSLDRVGVKDKSRIFLYYKLKDILYTQAAVLTAMINYSEIIGGTRGSSLCFDENGSLRKGLEDTFRFTQESGKSYTKVQETVLTENGFACFWRDVRPIPDNDDFFENVWRQYRENKSVY